MSAAATAAGYLYASGRLRCLQVEKHKQRQREAERAAVALKREREQGTRERLIAAGVIRAPAVTYRKRKALEVA